jgi:hypothetical protein
MVVRARHLLDLVLIDAALWFHCDHGAAGVASATAEGHDRWAGVVVPVPTIGAALTIVPMWVPVGGAPWSWRRIESDGGL